MKFGNIYDNSLPGEQYLSEDKERAYWYKTALESVKVINDGREHWMRPKKEWRNIINKLNERKEEFKDIAIRSI